MASFLDKLQVNTAITENTKLDLGHQHITTIDAFELQPSMTKEMVPGERLDVSMESFARLNPLPVPTFGRMSLRHRAFFVPYRTIFRGWNDFITDSVHVPSTVSAVSAIISSVPTVTNDTLVKAFISNSYGANIDTQDADAYEAAMTSDYMVFGVKYQAGDPTPAHDIDNVIAGASAYYDFTIKGRQAIKVLESLGYKVVWCGDKVNDTSYYDATYSALPLLALAKIYTDWYWPTQYTNLASYDDLVSLCNRDNDNNTFALSDSQVRDILKLCVYSQYDADEFTACWDSPNQPTSGTHSDFKLVNIDSISSVAGATYGVNVQKGYVTNNSGLGSNNNRIGGADAPFITPLTTSYGASGAAGALNTPVSQYLLHSLHALTDYMKRHQLVGSHAAERYLARFGKALSAEKLNRSVYLGAHMQDVQIGDIMSTADTEAANLGSYAGKGLSYNGGMQFGYSTDEYGLFIILTSLVPSVGYPQGIDRTVKHISKLDFWTPEFDSLGAQAVAADELYVPQHYGSTYVHLPQQTFGFLPTYYEYKVKNDKVTGNFRINSINGANPNTPTEFNASNSWYLMRMFDNSDFASASDIVHSASFVDAKNDMSQYKRIFYDVKASSPDNFTVINNFEIASFAPMKSLFDTYEFEDKGKKVTEDVNGVKMN